MNWTRIIAGGLVAGIVLFIMEAVAGALLLGPKYEAAMERMNLEMPRNPAAFVINLAMMLVLGLVLAVMYAAMRPRFGGRPQAAIVTAFLAWIPFHGVHGVFEIVVGVFSWRLATAAHGLGLIEFIVATLAAGFIYKEAPTSRAQRTATGG